ncbi:Saccharopine dehydrogenase (fragment) [Candidatus Sulfopaludibacter sp. SbA6]
MSRTVTFGIVGGYGATGRIVASELGKSTEAEILVGGRDLAKGKALAAEFDNRVSAAHVDILDAHSLDGFCRRCPIIVNCAGPVMVLQDRVAQAAFRGRCHYIDAAGMSLVRERMLGHSREIEDSGLSFVISAGWTPGLTELLPVYADAQARTRLDSIERMRVYFSDSGEWSTMLCATQPGFFISRDSAAGATFARANGPCQDV